MDLPEKFKGRKVPFYQDVDGFRLPGLFSPEAFRSALAYKPRPDDLFIATYPKCGTTWVQNIVAGIYREGRTFESALEFFSHTPFLEMAGAEAAEKMKRPGAIKIHLPYHMAPVSSEAKYIFVGRNPKDCCVSFYHFTENVVGYEFAGGDFDVFFELFMEGKTAFGDYFDTVLSWYEHRNDPNVLFTTYEELKKDTRASVLRIAEFMGRQYKQALENNEDIFQAVLHHSSFAFMKEHLSRHIEELSRIPKELILNNPDVPTNLGKFLTGEKRVLNPEADGDIFVRKGIVGDWRNYFSEEQNQRMESKFKERTAGTNLPKIWKDVM